MENSNFSIVVDKQTGAISSFVIKKNGYDLIGEKRLMVNFRLCLPLEDYLCNYIDGMEQKPASVSEADNVITVCFSGLSSERGTYPIDLCYTITLLDDQVRFKAKLTNNSDQPISEFWFPRLGGWTQFGGQEAPLNLPGYSNIDTFNPFKNFPGGRQLGTEAPEWTKTYPSGEMVMPWSDIYDKKNNLGLYFGYHDKVFRLSAWHMYLYPDYSDNAGTWLTKEQSTDEPVGIIVSHVRFPFIKSGETFESGEFIIRVHKGDWHEGSKFYRKWFLENFPFDKSKSWLRKQSSWFSSIIYQPEDKIIADYQKYDLWCKDAQEYDINCHELIGWERGGKCLTLVNYNVLDPNTQWYKKELYKYAHQDQFGKTPNWMCWGQSTLLARANLSTRRHIIASVVPGLEKILEDILLQIVRDGAHGFQIDKLCVAALDFNPLNTQKPDVAIYESHVQSIARIWKKCREINPDFCFAGECCQDRLLTYIDVYYRNSSGYNISPLRYVFPEWTSCQHIHAPGDFEGVNGAVLTGSVIDFGPQAFQGSPGHLRYRELALYIKEVGRIRKELLDIIFLGSYYDDQDAKISIVNNKISDAEKDSGVKIKTPGMMPGTDSKQTDSGLGQLHFKVHGHNKTDQRAIVLANASETPITYQWEFLHANVQKAILYEPFKPIRTVTKGKLLEIKGKGLQVLLEMP